MKGKHHSEETKKKIRNGNKGKIVSEETKKRMSNSHKGIKHSEKTKRKMSEAKKGKNNSFYGNHHSKGSRKKMSEAKKGKKRSPFSEDWKKKMSEVKKGKNNSFYGNHHSKETKQKISEKALQRIQNNSGPFKDTKPELKMKEIFNSLDIPFKHQFRLQNHLFDFCILGTNILIEVDGDYWHGNPKKFSKLNKIQKEIKQRDLEKEKLAKANNYILLRFWQDDILNNKEKVIQQLKIVTKVK